MIKEPITIDQAVELLNSAVESDRSAMGLLLANKVSCNDALADHETIVVGRQHGTHVVGLMGIINGLFGFDEERNTGAIAYKVGPDGLIGFARTDGVE